MQMYFEIVSEVPNFKFSHVVPTIVAEEQETKLRSIQNLSIRN